MNPVTPTIPTRTAPVPSATPRPRLVAQIPMARRLARLYGHATAARYLRKRGWSVDAALWILAATPTPATTSRT